MGNLGKKRSGASYGPPKRKAKRAEVAGPYQSQSSVPKIRRKATKHEHRTEPSTAAGVEQQKTRRGRRIQGATQQARKTRRKAKRVEHKSARTIHEALRSLKPPPESHAAIEQSRYLGAKPPTALRKSNPRAYKKAERAYLRHIAGEENLGEPEDITHAIEVASLLAGGAAAAKIALKGGEAAAGELLGRDAVKTAASVSGAGSKVAKAARTAKGGIKARAGAKVQSVRSAPTRYARRVKETPAKVKSAPKRAKAAASTKQGRRAAGKGGLRRARRHPVRSSSGAALISPVPLPGELDKRARALAKGTVAAVVNHPVKVAETTLHGALGAFTAPLAIGGAALKSAEEGSTRPFRHEIRDLVYVPGDKTESGNPSGLVGMAENLSSGEPKRVEQTTLEETGLTPFIPLPHIARRIKGTEVYQDTRGALRGKVEGKRAKTRNARVKAEKEVVEAGGFVPRKKARKIRQSVADTQRPGETYALRRTGKLIEKQRSRHYVAREVSRMEREGQLSGKTASEKISKILRKSKGTNQKEQNYGEALRVVVKHGLPRDQAKGMAFVNRLHAAWPKIEHGDVPAGVHLDRHSTQFILDHPEIFHDKHFWKAVEQFDEQSKPVGTSLRNQYLAQVDNLTNPILAEQGRTPILKPEEMIPPEAVKILPKRDKPWNRSEALSYARELREVKGAERNKALAQARALVNKDRTGALDGLMKPPEHGGAEGGVSTTRADAWTPEMEKAFVRAARRENARNGLRDPAAYVADRIPSGLKGSETASALAPGLPLRKVWPSRGLAAKSGNAESAYESLIYHSIEAPRSRQATVEGLNRIFDRASRELNGKRYLTGRQVETAINTHKVPDGTIFVRTQFLKSVLEGEHHLSPEDFNRAIEGEIEHGQKLAESTSVEQIRSEMEQAKASGVKGEKYSPMDAVAIHELMGHIKGPGGASHGIGKATNAATGVILNSPAFEVSQFFQEGIPGAAALGRNVVHLPAAIKNLRKINKLSPEDQGMIRAVVGSGAGVHGAPNLKALRSSGYMDPIRAAGGKQKWRHAFEILNGTKINRFDRSRGGIFREVGSSARIEGDFRRAAKGFKKWRSSTNNLFKGMEQAVNDMKGMTPTERQLYVSSHPALADRLTKAMDGQMGNWNSFTVFEKQIAPFFIFYNFQRYAVLWTLYHFPLDHPVVATALASLGEVNAQQLQKLAAKEGSTPNILDYTKPVINGKTVLPAGQRFFSGLSSVAQSALEGKPAHSIGALGPEFSIPLEAIGGKNTYTGAELGENGFLFALRQSGNLSPFLRFLGAPDVGKSPSAASQVFGQSDPLRDVRSLVNPLIGQTAKQFGEEKKVERKFNEKWGEGKIPYYGDSPLFQKIMYGFNGGPNPNRKERKREIADAVRKIHAQESAKNFIKRKEAPFLPPQRKIPEAVGDEIREAFEDAWKTGPNAKPEKKEGSGWRSGSSSSSEGWRSSGAAASGGWR